MRSLTALLLALAFALPAQAVELTPAANDYLAELVRVESATSPQSLESLFAKTEAVQDSLIEIVDNVRSDSRIESYSEAEFAELQGQLRGLHLQRGMEIYVQPLPDFFLKLAEQKGREADAAFFRLYRAYWGPTLFPVYMQPRALVVGCVKYGDGLLSDLYADWSHYAQRHPQAYAALVGQMRRDFEEVIELGTCACGDRASVIRELRGFVKRFPGNPAVPAANKRWRELKAHKEQLPLSCG